MLKVLSNILCDLDPTVKVIGQKAGICDGVPSTSALVFFCFVFVFSSKFQNCTPWRNDHNLIVPVLRERKKERKSDLGIIKPLANVISIRHQHAKG